MAEAERTWVAAHEGYYGAPLRHDQRLALVRWLGSNGFDGYGYSPKDDVRNRARWREPYTAGAMAQFAELQATCVEAGIELVVMLSPGLDWRAGDPSEVEAVVAKLAAFAELGVTSFAINWDDVPGTGAEDGAEHGGAVAAAIAGVQRRTDRPLRWMSCPVDYAVDAPTEYLAAFAAAIPPEVELAWTGPSVLTRTLAAEQLHELEATLDRGIAFCENFPVNDLGMADVLHLGPYPVRDATLVGERRRVFVNIMEHVVASTVGLAQAERFWHGDPARPAAAPDREAAWLEVVRGIPGLEPLARACRSWVADPEPDPELVAWATAALDGDDRLAAFLRAGCRIGLDPAIAAEVGPWLDQWDLEAAAMLTALGLLADGRTPTVPVLWASVRSWNAARSGRPQVFGIRLARYPMTRHDGQRLVADHGAVVHGTNLTDRLWAAVLDQLGC